MAKDITLTTSRASLCALGEYLKRHCVFAPLREQVQIPQKMVRYRPADKSSTPEKAVWILDKSNKPRRIPVMTGETDGSSTQITQGDLKDGDRVIVASLDQSASASNNSLPRTGTGRGPGF